MTTPAIFAIFVMLKIIKLRWLRYFLQRTSLPSMFFAPSNVLLGNRNGLTSGLLEKAKNLPTASKFFYEKWTFNNRCHKFKGSSIYFSHGKEKFRLSTSNFDKVADKIHFTLALHQVDSYVPSCGISTFISENNLFEWPRLKKEWPYWQYNCRMMVTNFV